MTKKKLLKTFALGLCMSSLFAGTMNMGTAYAQSGGGVSPSFGGLTVRIIIFCMKSRRNWTRFYS